MLPALPVKRLKAGFMTLISGDSAGNSWTAKICGHICIGKKKNPDEFFSFTKARSKQEIEKVAQSQAA